VRAYHPVRGAYPPPPVGHTTGGWAYVAAQHSHSLCAREQVYNSELTGREIVFPNFRAYIM
jgi:hypothetical protein